MAASGNETTSTPASSGNETTSTPAASGNETTSTPSHPSWFSPETGIYQSTYPSINLPSQPFLDVVSHIFSHKHDGIQALIDSSSGVSISYSNLLPMVKSMASGLHHMGVKQGDVILILLPNSIYFPIIFLGALSVGAVVITRNPLTPLVEIKKQILDSNASFAFSVLDRVDELFSTITVIGVPDILITDSIPSDDAFSKLISSDPNMAPSPKIRQEDTAAILYSSGVTGRAKGVVLTHANFIAAVELFVRFEASLYPSTNNVYVAVVPMYHVYGLALFAMGLLSLGSTIVTMKKFDADDMVRAISKYGVTHLHVVPPIMAALTRKRKSDTSDSFKSLKQVSCSGADLELQNINDFVATFPKVDLIQGYGTTESTALGTRGYNTSFANRISVGFLSPNSEAKVVNSVTGSYLPLGGLGELWLRSPGLMKGYLNNMEASMAAIDKDGWLHTGDVGFFDEEGYLYVLDRLKDTIKYKGFDVYCRLHIIVFSQFNETIAKFYFKELLRSCTELLDYDATGTESETSRALLSRPVCDGCGSPGESYDIKCKHLKLCISCGKFMAENRANCYECGTPITRLIREYSFRHCSSSEKKYFLGRFQLKVPGFKSSEYWSMEKEGLQGRQVTDALRENYKDKPWLLQERKQNLQFRGQFEELGSSKYYVLIHEGNELVAYPVASSYKFDKQLSLAEAEQNIKKREKTVVAYERRLRNASKSGPATFGVKPTNGESSNSGEEDEEEAEINSGLDLDLYYSDVVKGDDWDHIDVFSDDDEPDEYDPEYRVDLALEDEVDVADEKEEVKELRELLGRANKLDDDDKKEGTSTNSRPPKGATPTTKDIRELLSKNILVSLEDFADTFRPRLNFEKARINVFVGFMVSGMDDSSNSTGHSNWSCGTGRTCYCGNIVRMFTSKTPTNPGRRFLRCAGLQGQRCSFFEWIDHEVAIIPGLLQRINHVEANNRLLQEETMHLNASLLEIRASLNT
ncbi:hypothetical protein RD792_008994 [Penstemon davidsonii]|uniref:4-coumarate--CoA ligase n=1 Tax=Penstemon davidsonii TaxID=160366 RepID=A0ABR0DCA0_9LAMI|nr:hypothetical protein RD792_008994 [Penstemon davidsonii]